MPVHDWTRLQPGIFHDFHHAWIYELARVLNKGLLPDDCYAIAEQLAAGFSPDVPTLQGRLTDTEDGFDAQPIRSSGGEMLAPPAIQPTAETEIPFYRRKQNVIAVRHVSDDEIVAMIEIVSPGNKSSRKAMRDFVMKAAYLLDKRIHLLIIDVQPPTRRDPHGLHAVIWEEITGEESASPPEKPLALIAYECDLGIKAYVVPVAVGESLPDIPLFLEPGKQVPVPLEATYNAAFDAVPRRWRSVLEGR
jgi:hypothetical protein